MRLIDADALLEELEACDFVIGSDIGGEDTMLFEEDVIKRIKALPTIDSVKEAFDKLLDEDTNGIALIDDQSGKRVDYFKVKHGRWIEVENKWGGLEIRCSECGAQVPRDGWGNAMQCDYCPNCGARMMEGEDDERLD